MDGWPTQEAVNAALLHLVGEDVATWLREPEDLVREAVAAAGLPELMGATDAAAELGVATSNLGKVADLPEPLYAPDHEDPKRRTSRGAGRLYPADAVRALAARRRAS
jgi:hypothetical protein